MSVGNDKLRILRQIPTIKFEEEAGGYSKAQVNRVLDIMAPLADEIEALQAELSEAQAQAAQAHQVMSGAAVGSPDGDFDETLRNTLLLAQRTADQTVRDAEAKAEETRRESTAKADSIMAGARAEAKELKGEAHAQREQMLADAEAERAELLADALEHAETRKSAIEEELLAEQGLRRNELLAEISNLERSRDDLSADAQRLESFIEGRRASIASAVDELNAVLNDPGLLAETETPEPAEIGLLDPEELTPLSVESHSIGALSTEVDAAQQQAAEFAFTEPEPEPEPELDTDELIEATAPAVDVVPEMAIDVEADPVPGGEALVDAMIDPDAPVQPGGDAPGEFFDAPVQAEPVVSGEPPSFDTLSHDPEIPVSTPAVPEPALSDAGPSPAEEFAAAIDGDNSFPPAPVPAEHPQQDWQPFSAEAPEFAGADGAAPPPADPFATQGFAPEAPQGFAPEAVDAFAPEPGIAASVTPDSVFSSVPETADPSAYSDLPPAVETGTADPAGLGIDVESPFSDQAPPADDAQPGLGGLAEQARNRLASRVSKLRDTAVPEVAGDMTAPPAAFGATAEAAAPAFDPGPPAPAFEPGPSFEDTPAAESQFPPPPAFGTDSTPAFSTESVGGAEWSAPDPNRPMHPDAHLEDLPAADPFLDELRQRTDGDQAGAEDETLNRFLAEDGEKEGGGWFGRRNR